MAETKHTPGPWEVEDDTTSILSADGVYIGRAFDADDFPCIKEAQVRQANEEAEANARLMAASPSLLSDHIVTEAEATAAQNLWKLMKHGSDPTQAIAGILDLLNRIARRSAAAIAKAEGRPAHD